MSPPDRCALPDLPQWSAGEEGRVRASSVGKCTSHLHARECGHKNVMMT